MPECLDTSLNSTELGANFSRESYFIGVNFTSICVNLLFSDIQYYQSNMIIQNNNSKSSHLMVVVIINKKIKKYCNNAVSPPLSLISAQETF